MKLKLKIVKTSHDLLTCMSSVCVLFSKVLRLVKTMVGVVRKNRVITTTALIMNALNDHFHPDRLSLAL